MELTFLSLKGKLSVDDGKHGNYTFSLFIQLTSSLARELTVDECDNARAGDDKKKTFFNQIFNRNLLHNGDNWTGSRLRCWLTAPAHLH